jgi:hypothetical protein
MPLSSPLRFPSFGLQRQCVPLLLLPAQIEAASVINCIKQISLLIGITPFLDFGGPKIERAQKPATHIAVHYDPFVL